MRLEVVVTWSRIIVHHDLSRHFQASLPPRPHRSNLGPLETHLHTPCRNEQREPNHHRSPAKSLHIPILTAISRNKGTGNRIPYQRRERDEEEVGTIADADGADVGDLRDDGWRVRDVGAGSVAEEDREDDEGRGARGREPEGEDEDGGHEGGG